MPHDLLHYQMQIRRYRQDVILQIWELPFQLSILKVIIRVIFENKNELHYLFN